MFLSCSLQGLGFWRKEEWLPSLFVKLSIADYFVNFVLLIVARAISAAPVMSMVTGSIKDSEECDLDDW
jgi:hypothetical protein